MILWSASTIAASSLGVPSSSTISPRSWFQLLLAKGLPWARFVWLAAIVVHPTSTSGNDMRRDNHEEWREVFYFIGASSKYGSKFSIFRCVGASSINIEPVYAHCGWPHALSRSSQKNVTSANCVITSEMYATWAWKYNNFIISLAASSNFGTLPHIYTNKETNVTHDTENHIRTAMRLQ